jgi:tetratricopeptide (TPR) repeat protein
VHYQDENDFDEALKCSEEAHDIYHRLDNLNSDAYLERISSSHAQLGMLHKDTRNYEEATHYFDKAIIEIRKLVQIDSNRYSHELGLTLIGYAELKRVQKELENSLVYFTEALEIYENLAKSSPRVYLRWLATTLLNFGLLYSDLGNLEESVSLQTKALNIYRKLALENPDVYLRQVASSLGNLGSAYLALARDAETALKYFEEAYAVLKPFAGPNQRHNLYYLSRILRNFGFAYEAQGQHEEALTNLTETLEITNSLAEKNRYHLYDVAEIHEQIASVHFDNEEFADSAYHAKRALETYESLSQKDTVSGLKKLARLNFGLGAAYSQKGDKELAKEGFKRALERCEEALSLSKNDETAIDVAVEGMCYFFKAQVEMNTIQGTVDEDLDTYGTSFKSPLESLGLSDDECVEKLIAKTEQMFGSRNSQK